MEEDAILIGLTLEQYWKLNVKEYRKYVNAYNKRRKQTIEDMDYLNYVLGKYIAFAFNDPKHYPTSPLLEDNKKTVNMTDEEMEKRARYNTIKMGGVINDS